MMGLEAGEYSIIERELFQDHGTQLFHSVPITATGLERVMKPLASSINHLLEDLLFKITRGTVYILSDWSEYKQLAAEEMNRVHPGLVDEPARLMVKNEPGIGNYRVFLHADSTPPKN